jgi:hypothetical protein
MNDGEPEHPAFPQPNDPGATLWRYLDDWKFNDLLACAGVVRLSWRARLLIMRALR